MRLIAARPREVIALLGAGMLAASAPLFAGCADETDREPEPPPAAESAARPPEPKLAAEKDPIDGWEFRLQKKRDWWDDVREALFAGIELSAEQERAVDAIIEEQLATRTQMQQREIDFQAARTSRDAERSEAARAAVAEIRAQLKKPHEIYEELRALLGEDQRPEFDMNRARHVAKRQTAPRERAAQTEDADPAQSEAW